MSWFSPAAGNAGRWAHTEDKSERALMFENPLQRTALVIPVYEAIPYIQSFRAAHTPTPAVSLPPHITIRGPFIPFETIDQGVHDKLERLFRSQPQFEFTLQKIGCFEIGVLYLDPEPEFHFQALRLAVEKQFPEANSDFFSNRKMHVTIARCRPEEIASLESAFIHECGESLPITALAREVCLYEKHDGKWYKRDTFPLADAAKR